MIDLLDEHRHYLTDGRRLEAYRRALAAVVRPGATVLDLGAGTGVLGLLACEAGAGRVYAVDDGPMIDLARAIAAGSPHANRIVHLHGHSNWVDLPGPVDVIVTDQTGHFGPEVGMMDEVPAAAARFLRTEGCLVPAALTMYAAPVTLPEVRRRMETWRDAGGLDLSPAIEVERATPRPVEAPADALLAPGVEVGRLDSRDVPPRMFVGTGETTCGRDGAVDGLLGWFAATLGPGVTVTNAPGAADRLRRSPLYLPLDPLLVRPGDRLRMRIQAAPASGVVAWSVERADEAGCVHDRRQRTVLDSVLRFGEAVRQARPSHRPVLHRAGRARLEVLRRCDGRHAVADIERALQAEFPDVFRTVEDAGVFVATVLRAHAR